MSLVMITLSASLLGQGPATSHDALPSAAAVSDLNEAAAEPRVARSATVREVEPERPVATMRRISGERPWRLSFGVGAAHPRAPSAEWFPEVGEPTTRLLADRDLDVVLPGLAVGVGFVSWGEGRAGAANADLRLKVFELDVGATWAWPHTAFWGFVVPYGRVSLLGDWWRVRAGDNLGDDLFVPGARLGVGARVHMGRGQVLAEGATLLTRFFASVEAGYALRLNPTVRLSEIDEDEEDPDLPGPSTRLGKVNLSGFEWLLGVGMAF